MSLADVGAFLWKHYHKDWVDVGTFVCAGLYALWKWVRCGFKMRLRGFGRHVMDGSTVFPLALLALSVLSRHLVEQLLAASRVTLSIAGAFALLSVLEDDARGGED